MVSESPVNDPSTPNAKQLPRPPTPVSQPAAALSSDEVTLAQPAQGPHGQHFFFNREPPHDSTTAESGGALPGPFHAMPMFPHPAGGAVARPKRTQCKNACTNCQKACKKCDDNRPCHRCVRYGTTETCVDSKRKERKKGVKRGPYKKRDSKNHNADAEHDDGGAGSANSVHGPSPGMPYVGPVGYPPGMWGTYSPGGPVAKIEGGGYYQPVFALTPVAGQGTHSGESENTGGGGEAPHFPVGFYPATFISYPGPYPPYPIPPLGQGVPHGFHYAYPPPPRVIYPSRPQNMATSSTNGEPGAGVSGSTDSQNKDSPDAKATTDVPSKGESKDGVVESQVNGKAKLMGTVKGAAAEDQE